MHWDGWSKEILGGGTKAICYRQEVRPRHIQLIDASPRDAQSELRGEVICHMLIAKAELEPRPTESQGHWC